MSRPTILQIIPHLDAGGAERSAVEIARAVASAGGRALVLAESGRLASDLTSAGGEFRAFPAATKNPLRIIRNAHSLARIATEEGVDLIHARSRAPAWSALMAARLRCLPFVTTYHGAYSESNALKRFYNGVMARGDIIIANSRYTADLVAHRYGTHRQRIEIIHRGLDPQVFDPARVTSDRVSALRQRWGVNGNDRIILQAARLTSWKGQSVLIEAAARLKASNQLPNTVVVLAGDAQGRQSYVASLQSQIASAGLQAVVRIVGHVEDIAAAYYAAHVTVIASTAPEAFGRTAIEAAALGCPVVATAIGAPPETLLAGPSSSASEFTGWLVQPGDPAALAARLAEALLLTPEARASLADRARKHVLAHFTEEVMQRRTLAIYDRLLGTFLALRFCEMRKNALTTN